jgi:hypothetical protein
MKLKNICQVGVLIACILLFSQCKKNGLHFCNDMDHLTATTKVFATGLNNPRGLKFGPDNQLYVAEAGIGGTNTTNCTQVAAPIGPYTGSVDGSRISVINPAGVRHTYVDGLPSSQTSVDQGSLISGVSDVAFVGHTLYALFSGAGCSHGVENIPNGIIRVNPNQSWEMVADLSSFIQNNMVANPPADFEPDGTWYSMINVNGDLYAVEPNHGELDKVTATGDISRVLDFTVDYGHVVPTAQTFYDGNFYVGNLDLFPLVAGSSNIYKISPDGQSSVYATGFNAVLGVAFDQTGSMYVLENFTNNPFPTPGTGDVIRVDRSGNRQVIVSGLNLPTAMTFGPDGKLYISNWGYGMPPGGGEILQVTLSCDQIHGKMQK